MVTQAYQLYVVTCFASPQETFGLAPNTEVVFMMQSVQDAVTRRVLYQPFREMFLAMDYSRKWLKWNKYKESSLDLYPNLTVVPALAHTHRSRSAASCFPLRRLSLSQATAQD